MSAGTPQTLHSSLPRSGLPLNWMLGQDRASLFPNAVNQRHVESGLTKLPLTTLRELAIVQLLNKWSDELDWHIKIFDGTFVAKWKAEVLGVGGSDMSEYLVNYCIDELRHKAKVFETAKLICLYRGEVVKADSIVPVSVKEELKDAVLPLERVLTRRRDWKSGSNEQSFNIVDPSLFPLVYGRTRVLDNHSVTLNDFMDKCGEGIVLSVLPKSESDTSHDTHKKFQWLPCNVDISGDNDTTKITSYINNIHPGKHGSLYKTIETVIGQTIPLWNMTLTPLRGNQQDVRIPYHFCTYEPLDPDLEVEDEPEQEDDEENDDFHQRQIAWIADTHSLSQPDPDKFKPPKKSSKTIDLRKDYADQGLQIIIRLEHIYLTPEKPEYKSGAWQIEGHADEHICATALYYYDCINIGPSQLTFRQQSSLEDAMIVDHPPNQHAWLSEIFGCEFEEAAVQEVGSISIKEGRLVSWPNILQHRTHVCLADPGQPGHCKILALHLVDPGIRILSTAEVPCQRRDWWAEAVLRTNGPLNRLPVELRENVFSLVEEFPLGMDEAIDLRREMMEERKVFGERVNELFEEDHFICGH